MFIPSRFPSRNARRLFLQSFRSFNVYFWQRQFCWYRLCEFGVLIDSVAANCIPNPSISFRYKLLEQDFQRHWLLHHQFIYPVNAWKEQRRTTTQNRISSVLQKGNGLLQIQALWRVSVVRDTMIITINVFKRVRLDSVIFFLWESHFNNRDTCFIAFYSENLWKK